MNNAALNITLVYRCLLQIRSGLLTTGVRSAISPLTVMTLTDADAALIAKQHELFEAAKGAVDAGPFEWSMGLDPSMLPWMHSTDMRAVLLTEHFILNALSRGDNVAAVTDVSPLGVLLLF